MSKQAEEKGLAEPFKGITTNGTFAPGLFAIRSTGVSTEPVRKAADALLQALTPEQRKIDEVSGRRPGMAQVDESTFLHSPGHELQGHDGSTA